MVFRAPRESCRLAICNSDPIYLYLGCLDGEPVATSVLYLGARVAGIYDVTTVEWDSLDYSLARRSVGIG